jgi:thiamine transporter ThiT
MMESLFTLSRIQSELEYLFTLIPADIQPDCNDLRLKKSNLAFDTVYELQALLDLKFPASFTDVLLRYDLGDFTAGRVWFGSNETYDEYIAIAISVRT